MLSGKSQATPPVATSVPSGEHYAVASKQAVVRPPEQNASSRRAQWFESGNLNQAQSKTRSTSLPRGSKKRTKATKSKNKSSTPQDLIADDDEENSAVPTS